MLGETLTKKGFGKKEKKKCIEKVKEPLPLDPSPVGRLSFPRQVARPAAWSVGAVGSGVVPRDDPGAIPSPGVDVCSRGGISGSVDFSSDGPSVAGGMGDGPAAPGIPDVAAGEGLEVGLASVVPAGKMV